MDSQEFCRGSAWDDSVVYTYKRRGGRGVVFCVKIYED